MEQQAALCFDGLLAVSCCVFAQAAAKLGVLVEALCGCTHGGVAWSSRPRCFVMACWLAGWLAVS